MIQIARFQELFKSLTGNDPFPWQTELGRRFSDGDIPTGCNLPTGTGKTSVIPIWLIALGLQAQSGPVILPRRLVYAVNRRVIVDQATEEVTQIIAALAHPADPELIALRAALETLSITTARPFAAAWGSTSERDASGSISTGRRKVRSLWSISCDWRPGMKGLALWC